MIRDFDEVKRQLAELSEVINKFKSEAVQLRIIELVFSNSTYEESAAYEANTEGSKKPVRRTRKRKTKSKTAIDGDTKNEKNTKARRGGTGAVATLNNELVDSNFFDTKRTIGDIVKYCEEHLARRFKANEFSGALGRLTRSQVLARSKNGDGQYEYIKNL